MHFNEGGFEHLVESDYEQARDYGKTIQNIFADSGISLAQTLSVAGEALVECGLDQEKRVQQRAFFRGMLEASGVMPPMMERSVAS